MKVYCVFEDDRPDRSYLTKIFVSYDKAKAFVDEEMKGYAEADRKRWEKYYQIEDWELCGADEVVHYNVEFVSYDGKYPNLCAGVLILKVNDTVYTFAKHSLQSGGSTYFTNHYRNSHINEGDWDIVQWPSNFPEGAQEKAKAVVNDNVQHGCCGGCL